MTSPVGRRAAGWRRPSRPQWAGALVAVAASLAALSLPGAARADTGTGYDQMTGVGSTASAISVNWTSGLLGDSNTALSGTGLGTNADRTNQSSSLWFMYSEFQNLQVTVSQTDNIAHQGITVSWNWPGAQTSQSGGFQDDFLQMMECYGDAPTGPNPEDCEFGSAGLLPSGVENPGIGERTGPLCAAGAVASTTDPPRSLDGSPATYGCDPLEPSDPTHLQPCSGGGTSCDTDFIVPFDPVTDTNQSELDYGIGDTANYDEFDTNEVQAALVNSSGTGQQQFETLTGVQAPGLGCGLEESDSQPRDCWLVIVPRGTYEPNGFEVNPSSGQVGNLIDTSPLSASNWDMRIQIHLDYAPVGAFCPAGTQEIQTFGTQIVTRAMQSWQIALNQAGDCKQVFAYSAVPETQSTLNLTAGGDVGLAFTTIPIGSEATRDGGTAPTDLPTILYAPVAIAALDFGFNINLGTTGAVTTPIELTPLLLAKALTQSYRQDLPDYFPDYGDEGPSWAAKNPINISADPEFQALNPEVPQDPFGPIPLLLTEDHSALNQQVWQWIQADPTASGWLNGTPDTTDGQDTVVDPDYQSLNLGTPPAIDSYPRAYTGVLSYTVPGTKPAEVVTKDTTDLLPYTDNFDSAASAVLTGADKDLSGGWDTTIQSPSNTPGWWDTAGTEPLGHIFMWAADDTPDLAAYGLIPAQLCNDSGSTCISPTTASVTAAVSDATADSAGLLEVNPASPGTGAYPLTDVIYAAVATNQSAAALDDYASLISYAVGTGQTPGASPGDLPPGYLPLPANLVSQAQAVVTQLQNLASPSPSASSSSPSPSSSSSSASSSSSSSAAAAVSTSETTAASSTSDETSGATAGATPTPTPAAAPTTATTSTQAPAPTSSLGKVPVTSSSYQAVALSSPTTPGGPVISLPQAQVAAGTTPQQAVGAFRWVLIGVAIVGAGFAGGGTILRAGGGGLVLWRRRRLL
jgi:hypothetical protein